MSLILKHWLKVKLWKTYIIFGEWAFVFAGTGEHSNGIISYIDFCGKANKFRKLWSFYVSLYTGWKWNYGVCGHRTFCIRE